VSRLRWRSRGLGGRERAAWERFGISRANDDLLGLLVNETRDYAILTLDVEGNGLWTPTRSCARYPSIRSAPLLKTVINPSGSVAMIEHPVAADSTPLTKYSVTDGTDTVVGVGGISIDITDVATPRSSCWPAKRTYATSRQWRAS
jgi:hypothetical protein